MYIGIDIGGTNIRVVSSESVQEPKIIDKIVFLNSPEYLTNESMIIQAILKLSSQVEGIGIGMMGRLNPEATGITHSRSAPQWMNKPVATKLENVFHCPVIINGDQYCGALSEAMTNERKDSFFYVTFGTGISFARVRYEDTQPVVQKNSDEEHAIYCKAWQDACGGKWIEKTYHKAPADLSESEWATIMGHFYDYFVKFVIDMNPPRIVFGGGMAFKQWSRLQPVFSKFKSNHPELQNLDIRLAHYGEEAGLYGALYLVGLPAASQ